MTYDEQDAAMDRFYDQVSEELYPEHKEQAIEEFVSERMQSYFLGNPRVIRPPIDCYHHANELIDVSPRCALVMYTTAIELFLKSVLLKPVLYGMIHNEKVADSIVDATTGQSGFSRYNKLLGTLCLHAANIQLSSVKGVSGKAIISEAEEVQGIRNRVIHRGSSVTAEEMGKAKNVASLILTDVVEPVLNNLGLALGKLSDGFGIVKV